MDYKFQYYRNANACLKLYRFNALVIKIPSSLYITFEDASKIYVKMQNIKKAQDTHVEQSATLCSTRC